MNISLCDVYLKVRKSTLLQLPLKAEVLKLLGFLEQIWFQIRTNIISNQNTPGFNQKKRKKQRKKQHDFQPVFLKTHLHCALTEDNQSCGFPSSYVWLWELYHKEGWAPKNWCFLIVVLQKTLESPMDCKEIKPVHPKGNQSWILIGRTDAEAPILGPPDAKNELLGKDPDAGKDWRQKKGTTEDEMVGWWTQVWVSSGSWW